MACVFYFRIYKGNLMIETLAEDLELLIAEILVYKKNILKIL